MLSFVFCLLWPCNIDFSTIFHSQNLKQKILPCFLQKGQNNSISRETVHFICIDRLPALVPQQNSLEKKEKKKSKTRQKENVIILDCRKETMQSLKKNVCFQHIHKSTGKAWTNFYITIILPWKPEIAIVSRWLK